MYQGLAYEIEGVMPQAVDTGLFVSLCSFNQPSGALGPSGAPVTGAGAWVPVANLQNIPCKRQPVSNLRIQATEVRQLEEILSLQVQHVLLNGYYPDVTGLGSDDNWQAVIDGVAYTLMGAESDSQSQMTRCEVRLAQI